MGWTGGVSTGIVFLDYIVRPLLKIILKFPLLGFAALFAIYGTIAYHALKSAYLSDR